MKLQNHLIILLIFLLASCSSNRTMKPSVVEIIDMDYRFSTNMLKKFCEENDISLASTYQWQNRWTIYTDQSRVHEIAEKMATLYPRLKINVFEHPFYNFNREKYKNEKPATNWENIIMTANLVNDTVKQKEYMAYHRTQFEKWPEISKGFSNAQFQQVLVFRLERQLMLVISIPKGKTLDELNPKTSENNPRVDEWNKMMAHYQEGVEDAPKGTVWVMFQKTAP